MVATGARWPAWVYITIMSMGVLVCGHLILFLTRRKNRISDWPTTLGQIEWLRVSEQRRPVGFSIEASYTFRSAGKPYMGTAVSILDRYAGVFKGYDRLTAMRLQDAYREKRPVTVHLCPYDIQQSVLLDAPLWKVLVGSGLLGLMALATLCSVSYFDRPSPTSWTIGLLLGCTGYWIWTRWQSKPFPQG